jgi:stage II sporulation protein D
MRRLRSAARLAAAAALAFAAEASCRSAAPVPAPVPKAAPVPSVESLVAAPMIRIGVQTDGRRASLGADEGLLVWEIDVPPGRVGRRLEAVRASFAAQPSVAGAAPTMRLLETGDELTAVLVAPRNAVDLVSLGPAPYRGVFEVRAAGHETLTLVNVVNLEDYLRGVVPNELSPQAYPEIEALKAQAVAARTYALRNMGQYRAKGYDLCATATCQVYRGVGSEHALSDQAVADTQGVAASYGGRYINAMYTSTCGGHTEDGVNIFEGEDQPYLRGVVCVPERGSWARIGGERPREPLGPEEDLNRDVALLEALGVVEPALVQPKTLRGAATTAEVREWTTRLQAALGRRGCESAVDPPLARRGSFVHHVVDSFCWDERARRLLTPEDGEYLLQVEDAAALASDDERQAAALLLREGVLRPFADNTLRPNTVITRAQAMGILARAAMTLGSTRLVHAGFRRLDAGGLTVRAAGEEEEENLPLASSVRLFRALEGRSAATSELTLTPDDALLLVLREGRIVLVQAEPPLAGVAADRSSRYYSWEVRLRPAQLASAIARYGDVGVVRDVVPKRIGVSGRVVEMEVVGDKGSLSLHGMRIRWGLGLRENLFVIDREHDSQGRVARFIFTGKGWGHGVGLCQIGSYGLARSGAKAEAILRHYYTGITLAKAY